MKQLNIFIILIFIFFGCQENIRNKEKHIQNSSKKVDSNYAKKKKDSNFIYNKKIDYKNIEYQKIGTSSIKGLSRLSCDKELTRFVELPNKNDIRLILIPIDCGDFEYRYYLLTIKNDSVISDLYVEGVWNEPDSGEGDEITSFSIDKNFVIKVVQDFNKEIESKEYSIDSNGLISEL